ncbi:globin domain-containing protein [Kocuria marina]|uniref:nitric oxide dioxygenase n=1 Tax=Kocuria marina subsp. indica TaxID=1049583 RepID=A0A1X7D6T4_9MICC|nr:globin domain-containing protein [Kocuria indica]OXS82927.1 hemin transporter [Kocuria indica]RLP57837.1 hemin transporter [Kocuria indica]SMF09921.1 nitric oxide dioxygenase [Kocuria indica]
MLSDTAYPVVKATLPVVGENIQEIARRFYAHMFGEHPELLDGLFNRGNQADGRQQQALAGSVAAYAGYLVNSPTEVPDRLLSRIAHKHVSLGLRPDQYQIVHDHLMWAIVDVLGDAVTPEVAAAWDEVYWLMANALINQERGLYEAVRLSPETVWRTWRVVEKTRETDDVVTFVVERADEREVKPSLPGQYVTLKMEMPDRVHQPRQYSLTRADDGLHRVFAVKRVPGNGTPAGEMSTLLHDRVQVGDELTLSVPSGDVVLEYTDRPVVLASAGIGITPMAGMLSHLVKAGAQRKVMFLHANTSAEMFPLREQVIQDLAKLADGSLMTWFAERSKSTHMVDGELVGRMDVGAVDLPTDAQYYLCGPLPFMQAIRSDLIARGVPAKDIQYEVFGPDLWLADFQ